MSHIYSFFITALHRCLTVVLLVMGAQSLALAQTISSFTPTSGAPGTVITITGTNLTGATGLTFNGVTTTGLTVMSSTTLTAYVPVGATTGPLVVAKTSSTGTSATNFTVLAIPPAVQVSVTPAGPLSACASPTLTAAASLKPFLPGGTGVSGPAFATVLQPDGKILVGGYFARFNTSTRGGVVRLNADGTLDTSFAPTGTGFDYDVRTLALQPDGKVLVGGYVTSYNGTPVGRVARLNANGTLDATFVQNGGTGFDGLVYTMTVQPDGKILVGGQFTNYNSNLRTALARLNADGTLDTSFVLPGSGIVGSVYSIIVQPDGRLLIGGYLQTVNNVARGSIIRLNADGSLDASFASTNGVAYSTVISMVRQPDGKVVAGGGFASPSGTALSIGRLNANGTRDNTFAPTGFGLSNTADALALQPDGRIIAMGAFTSYNGTVRNHLARLNADGTLDATFASSGAGPGSGDGDLALQPDGKTVIVGGFSTFGGVAVARTVRVNADGTLETAATAAPGATYVWSPGGSTGATTVATVGGSYQATATVNGYSFLSNTVTVTGCAPTLTGISPGSGPVGSSLVLTGTNLSGATLITFTGTSGNTVSTGFTVNAAGTQITDVVVPAGAQTGTIAVVTPGGTATSTGIFTLSQHSQPSQPLVITGVLPTANARAAARTTPVTITFDQAVTTTSAAALKVYSAQRGGLRTRGATPAVASGNTITFAPGAAAFLPGETVFSTVTTAAQASAGGTLAQPSVQQFTAAVGGTGRGIFTRTNTLAVPNAPNGIAAGDVDGDGDVDLVTANTGANALTVLLNNGSGSYTLASTVVLPQRPFTVALGDVDGDGDLDAVAAVFGPGGTTVSTRLNGGNGTGSNTGTFSSGSDLVVGDNPTFLALGDVDGDGDLDVAVAVNGATGAGTTVRIGLNGGDATGSNTGVFSNGSTVAVGTGSFALALGDVDNDHDLDLATSITGGIKISLNAGNGTFGGGSTVALLAGAVPQSVALADVNADGYLDVLTETSVRLNTANGSGTFGGGSDPLAGTAVVYTLAVDVDADGDLDLVGALAGGTTAMSVRLNNGAGIFSGGTDLSWGQQVFYLAAADVDGDGDVDVVAAAPKDTPSLSVLLNGPAPAPTITSFTPTSGPAGTTVTINGTNLGGTNLIAFGGTANNTVASGYVVNAAGTQITGVVVPSGAQTGPISLTTPGGTATSSTSFTVPVPVLTSISPNSGTVGTSVTLTGTNLNGATQVSFNGNITSTFTSNSATQVVLLVPSGATTGPVTVTTPAGTSNALTFTVTCPVATITYGAATYCQTGSTNPTPSVTGPTGGTFASTPGLALNASTGTIALASSAPGSYTISYTAGTATCPTTATAQVTVTAAPSAAFTYGAPAYCPNAGAVPTPTLGGNATAGTFTATPAGLSLNPGTGAIALLNSQPGTYSVTNAVAASNGCAAVSATAQVIINALPTAAIAASGPTTFCQGGSVTLTASGGTGYLWSTGATTASITVSASGSYGVTVANAAGCTATANTAVTVNPATSAAFAYSGSSFCVSGTNPTPSVTGTAGGTFSATAGLSLNAATGAINLANSTPGTYTVTYSVAGSCPSSATASVTITAAPVASFSYAGSAYCVSAPNPAPTLPSGSTAGVFSSTAGLVLNAATGAVTLAASTPGTYVVTNTVAAANGCAAVTATQTVTINAAPTATLTTTTPTTFCTGGSVVLTAPAGAGNTYQFFNGGTSLGAASATNTFTASAAGSYTVVVTNAAACQATSTAVTVTVNPLTTATFSFAGSSFCVSGTNPTPGITGTAGGAFSSTTGLRIDAATGVINLGASTPGTYTVTYAVSGSCPSSATQSVTITAPATAAFSYPAAGSCAGSANTLTPTLGLGATAGTFTLPAATGLSVNATTGVVTVGATAVAGTYTVTNTVAATGGCAAVTSTAALLVNPAAVANAGAAQTLCSGSTAQLGVTPVAGTTYAYSPATGLSNATIANPTVTLTNTTGVPITTTYTLTATTASGCVATATVTVTVNPVAVATFSYGAPASFCTSQTTAQAAVLGTGATSGTFSSTTGLTLNATTGAITPSTSTPGTYTVTNTVAAAGGCAAVTATTQVTIGAAQTATFSYANAIACAGSAALLVPTLGGGATAGTFSAATGLTLNATTGAVNPLTSTAGTYTVTNTVAAAGGCAAATSTSTVTINALPATPNYTYIYPTPSTVLFTSSVAPAGTTYQWYVGQTSIPGATGQTYTANGATAPGSYTVRFLNTATGCQSAASTPLTVTAARNVIAGASLKLYPNPTPTGTVKLELTGFRSATQLTVLDALGRVVLAELLPANAGTATHALNLTGAATGVYLLRLSNAEGVETHRLVRE